MLIARVIGHGHAAVQHRSLRGTRLLLVEPLRAPSTDPVLAMDRIGAAVGDRVLVSSDGESARNAVGDPSSPLRWTVVGIVDAASVTGMPGPRARRTTAGGRP
ncbi:MAG: ethanolamine utilization protein EutN [Planctomycetes bacterium]|nr:ethanolamine utilization protein EutN [Planctomycetota bacterium]